MISTGERIEEIAKERGLNLHKLATKADVSYNTLYSIVRRKSDKIDWDIARKIAAALEVSPEVLFGVIGAPLLDDEENPIEAAEQHIAAIKNTRYAHAIEFSESWWGRNIIDAFRLLNENGKREAAKRVQELCHVPQYTDDIPSSE